MQKEIRPTRILLVEDDIEQAGLIAKIMAKTGNGFEINWVPQLSQGLERLEQGGVDLVILDLGLPDSQGLETFMQVNKKVPNLPVVVLTGLADENLGLAAVRQGAQDYLVKGSVDYKVLAQTIRYALERRRSQEALLAERQRLYSVLNSLPAAVYLKAPDYSIRFANRIFREYFGSPEGRHCYEIMHGRENPCEVCPGREALQTQKSQLREYSRDNGRTYEVSYHPFNDLDGSPLLLNMSLDITARKQAEEALQEREEQLATIYEHAPLIMLLLDGDRRVCRANKLAEQFTGKKAADLVRRHAGEALNCVNALDDPQGCGLGRHCQDCTVRCTVLDTFATGRSHRQVEASLPFVIDGKSEKVTFLLCTARLLVQGQPQVLVTIQDISERKRMEEALKESETKLRFLTSKLLSAQEDERKRLSQGLHDELGHALLAMKLDLGAMAKQLLPEQNDLKENVKELMIYVDEVVESVRRLYLNLTPGDLEDLGLTAALKSLCEEFSRHQEKISWSIELENIDRLFPVRVQTAVYRVFQEILTNIGKHADPSEVVVQAQDRDGQVYFEVRDNGKGFDMNNGWQSSVKAGMGLLTLEERIRMLGGSLKIWSKKNQGTSITFNIPVAA
jgi:signal transduction histidine kinase/DNA-binding response OmpR family regulator